jgi:NADPH-dependent 7-cyano-7-deazaguanine reductase QueF
MIIPNDCNEDLTIAYHPAYSTICTIGKRPFWGELLIQYNPDKFLLEFEEFERWLATLAMQHHTVESLCSKVFDELTIHLGPVPLLVVVHAQTTVHAPVSAKLERL